MLTWTKTKTKTKTKTRTRTQTEIRVSKYGSPSRCLLRVKRFDAFTDRQGPSRELRTTEQLSLGSKRFDENLPARHRPSGSDVDFQVAGGGVHAVSAWATMDPEGRAVAGPRVGCGAVTVASADTQS